MNKPWFHPKKYGFGWGLPATWQGWIVLFEYYAYLLYQFIGIDSHSHSVSDTLLNFIPRVILASVILLVVVRLTSGKPHWRWGKK